MEGDLNVCYFNVRKCVYLTTCAPGPEDERSLAPLVVAVVVGGADAHLVDRVRVQAVEHGLAREEVVAVRAGQQPAGGQPGAVGGALD